MPNTKKFLDATGTGYLWTKITAAINAKDTSIAAAKKAGDDAQADVDALALLVGSLPNNAVATTVVGYVDEKAAAATYDDTALAGRVSTVEGAITTLNGDAQTTGSVSNKVATAVAAIVADAPAAYDTLKEIADWISSHGTSAASMSSDINTLKSKLGVLYDENTDGQTLAEYIEDALEALDLDDYYTKTEADAAFDAIGAAAAVLGTAQDAASANTVYGAKAYADSLASNYDAAGSAAAAEAAAKSYADGLASGYATAAQGALADTALQPADVVALTSAEIDTALGISNS